MPSRVEHVLLAVGERQLDAEDAAHDLVGRRLVHAALVVDARADAGTWPDGGCEHVCAGRRGRGFIHGA